MKSPRTIYSDGRRLSANLYTPDTVDPAKTYPVVVCCHGWTAPLMEHLEASSLPQTLAKAGFFVLTFDARGWGESEGELVAEEPVPADANELTLKVRVVRHVLDPMAWLIDIQHAIDYIEGEPGVDPDRIGIWGSSFGGGTVIAMGALDPRVKCIVSQIAAQDMRGKIEDNAENMPLWTRDELRAVAIRQAREGVFPGQVMLSDKIAEAMHVDPQPLSINPGLRFYNPVDMAKQISVPTLILDAEDEPHWDIRKNGGQVYENMKASGTATVEYVAIPNIGHDLSTYYNMPGPGPQKELTTRTVDWFKSRL